MILGHNRQIEYFNKVLLRGRMAHAYLFYGPEHIGKLTFAKLLAKTLFCEKSSKAIGNECGSCNECRAADTGMNQGFIFFDTEHTLVSKKDKRKDIPIEDIRELRRRLAFAPEGEKWRVVIMSDAEKLSPSAADAFLKILEEPGAQTLIILITSSRESILPTIISRTQPVRFSLVPEDALLAFIGKKEKDKKRRELISAISSGRPGIVTRLLEEEGYMEKELKFLQDIDFILDGGALPEALVFAEKAAQSADTRDKAVEYIMRILRKNLLDSADLRLAVKLKRIADYADILNSTNVNPRLAMDTIFLEAIERT